jgi:hypothetical protein
MPWPNTAWNSTDRQSPLVALVPTDWTSFATTQKLASQEQARPFLASSVPLELLLGGCNSTTSLEEDKELHESGLQPFARGLWQPLHQRPYTFVHIYTPTRHEDVRCRGCCPAARHLEDAHNRTSRPAGEFVHSQR